MRRSKKWENCNGWNNNGKLQNPCFAKWLGKHHTWWRVSNERPIYWKFLRIPTIFHGTYCGCVIKSNIQTIVTWLFVIFVGSCFGWTVHLPCWFSNHTSDAPGKRVRSKSVLFLRMPYWMNNTVTVLIKTFSGTGPSTTLVSSKPNIDTTSATSKPPSSLTETQSVHHRRNGTPRWLRRCVTDPNFESVHRHGDRKWKQPNTNARKKQSAELSAAPWQRNISQTSVEINDSKMKSEDCKMKHLAKTCNLPWIQLATSFHCTWCNPLFALFAKSGLNQNQLRRGIWIE